MQLIGQKTNLEIINKWDKLPNFTIIQGDRNTGKKYMVLYLCEKFNLYYKEIKPTVKNIRDLLSIMVPDSNTVYHLDNFEEASVAAKNALLKVTEEPVRGNYIIITGGPQIKTLESRARRIIMTPYSLDEIKEFVKDEFTEDKLLKLYTAGINTPAKIKQYKDFEQLDDTLNLAFNIFSKITFISIEDIITTIRQFEDRYDKGIDKCELFLSMLLNIIEYNIKVKGNYSFINYIKPILYYKTALKREPTLRRRMLIYRLLYEFYNLRVDVSGV